MLSMTAPRSPFFTVLRAYQRERIKHKFMHTRCLLVGYPYEDPVYVKYFMEQFCFKNRHENEREISRTSQGCAVLEWRLLGTG